MDLLKELTELLDRLESERIEYALCGGLAMAVYAFPRATLDIDVMIEPESLGAVKALAKDLGYSLDVGLLEFQQGAIRIYRLTKIPAGSPDALVLDLLLVTPQIREAWDGRRRLEWVNGTLSVVSPEGLIALKTMRHSGQDQDDIERLKEILDEE
ncbi:hypothetical protein FJY63_00390 [Candidatus Sumerlaeota bacterium]|nr:hypothetical protein [Candidatus Sumerlaeota bacterium]